MIPRIRMARKRLAIARERFYSAIERMNTHYDEDHVLPPIYWQARDKAHKYEKPLRAIERRKDRIA
jgi:hypothetical protein